MQQMKCMCSRNRKRKWITVLALNFKGYRYKLKNKYTRTRVELHHFRQKSLRLYLPSLKCFNAITNTRNEHNHLPHNQNRKHTRFDSVKNAPKSIPPNTHTHTHDTYFVDISTLQCTHRTKLFPQYRCHSARCTWFCFRMRFYCLLFFTEIYLFICSLLN